MPDWVKSIILYSAIVFPVILVFFPYHLLRSPQVNKVTKCGSLYEYVDTMRVCNGHPGLRYTVTGTSKPTRKDRCIHCMRTYHEHQRIVSQEEKELNEEILDMMLMYSP